MKVVLDTNVFVSGVFFGGPPHRILQAWEKGEFQLALSPEILEEYYRVGETLAGDHPNIDLNPVLDYIIRNAEIYSAPALPETVCEDSDDDKFLACALACGGKIVVSGDKHLLRVSGYQEIEVLKPRDFVNKYLA